MAHPSKRSTDRSLPVPVIVLLVILFVVLAITLGWYCARPTRAQLAQQISFGASAESQVIVIGTLAPLGSFDYETAPLVTRLAVVKRDAAVSLLRDQITREQAEEVQARGDSAYAVIAQATRLCDPAPHTGKCRRPRAKVDELLEEATRQVAAVPNYIPRPVRP